MVVDEVLRHVDVGPREQGRPPTKRNGSIEKVLRSTSTIPSSF
jgi:hypothetical protein